MAEYEQKAGQGAIFKNKDKTNDKHPDYKGKFKDLQGNDFEISLWNNKAKSGLEYFSCKIQMPYVKQVEVIENKEVTKSEPLIDDGQLPF